MFYFILMIVRLRVFSLPASHDGNTCTCNSVWRVTDVAINKAKNKAVSSSDNIS